MILPTTWPFPSQDKQDAATDQRECIADGREPNRLLGYGSHRRISPRGERNPSAVSRNQARPLSPILDDVQDAPY